MPQSESETVAQSCPVDRRSPADTDVPRVPLYKLADNPHGVYAEMRARHGSLVPVDLAPEVPATLVVSYRAAVRILNDPDHFPADPRRWQDSIPADCPVRPMMEWFPAARNSSGADHLRYREASVAAIDGVDLHALPDMVERITMSLVNSFPVSGSVDLVSEFAFPLVLAVLDEVVGCPAEIGAKVAEGMAARFDGVKAAEGMETIKDALMKLVALKRVEPGDDMATRLLQHRANLNDVEAFAQLMSFYGAGFEAQRNLFTNAMLLMLTDKRFGGNLLSGSLNTRDALDEVLFDDPPLANFCTTYPRQPIMVDGIWLAADQPVVISLAACNNDPAIRGESAGVNRSHLAWSAGPHACPAKDLAYLTVCHAIDYLLDALPDMALAVGLDELAWRPGPFHRALAALPVTFPEGLVRQLQQVLRAQGFAGPAVVP